MCELPQPFLNLLHVLDLFFVCSLVWFDFERGLVADMIFVKSFTPADFEKFRGLPEKSAQFATFLTLEFLFMELE